MHRHRAGLPTVRRRRDLHDQPAARSRARVARRSRRSCRSEAASLSPAAARPGSRPPGSPPRRATRSFSSSGRTLLGGQLRQAAAGPTREELLDFVFWLERELDRLGVEVRLGTEATAAEVKAASPDLFVCAAGAAPAPPAFPIGGDARVVTCGTCSSGRAGEIPERALVVDDGGGFWQGVSAAELLAQRRRARRDRDARACGGNGDPGGERRERPAEAPHERRRVPVARGRDRRRGHDGAARRRHHRGAVGDEGRSRRRGHDPDARRRARRRARRSRAGARRDRRLCLPAPAQPRRARGERRASAASTRAGSERPRWCSSDGDDRVLADGRHTGAGDRDRRLRAAVRGVGLGRHGDR